MFSSDPPTCSDCGGVRHIHPWHCPLDLHGEADWMKARCCQCEQEIPSNAPREADRFGNLYCSKDCLITGQQVLMLIIEEHQERIDLQNHRETPV